MTWLLLSLASALSWSLADVFAKQALQRASAVRVAWVRTAFALPVLGAVALATGITRPVPAFWPTLAAAVPLEIAAALLYQWALRLSPLGLTAPYLAFTPAFLVFTGRWILGEVPAAPAYGGIALVCAGGYLLHLEPGMGWLDPVRALGRERGSVLMLAVAALYSVTAALGKVAVLASDPVTFGLVYYGILTACLTPWAVRGAGRPGRSRPLTLGLVGLFSAAMILAHFSAIRLAPASYMIAVKRTSVIWSILLGGVVFSERGWRRRLLGGAVMVAGVGLIAASF
ncbi:DMT family transporter [Deferrisoma camini]|uniref:DMT family transporter n=1 Tax=Deferrisoma camini TaxID=1035120 RepID=UPI00046C9324|nr:DMT family transporter [Deferrisoma camini]